MVQVGLNKDKQIEEMLELVLEKTLKVKELVDLLAERKFALNSSNKTAHRNSFQEEIESLTDFAINNKLVEQLGEKLKISKAGERFLFSSRIYAR